MRDEPTFGSITRWAKVPAWWLLHPGVDADRFCVLAALATYADEQGFCEPSQATLARHLKRSRPWVNRVVADLAEAGLLTKEMRTRRNGGTTSCLYKLVFAASELRAGDVRMSAPSQTVDTPRHCADTNQVVSKQIHYPRPQAREEHVDVAALPVSEPQQDPLTSISAMPDDWKPSAEALQTALSLCPTANVVAHSTMFASRCRAKGYRYLPNRLDDAWLCWFAEDAAKGVRGLRSNPQNRTIQPSQHATAVGRADSRFAAWVSSAGAPPFPAKSCWS